jgi:hypothetical protein
VIHRHPDADVLPDGVVVVTLDQAKDDLPAGQAQAIEILGAAEGAVDHLRPQGAGVVMEDVVRPE